MVFLVHLRQLISMIPLVLFTTGNRSSSRPSKKSNSLKKLKRTNSFRDENSIIEKPEKPRYVSLRRLLYSS